MWGHVCEGVYVDILINCNAGSGFVDHAGSTNKTPKFSDSNNDYILHQ